MAFGRLVGLTGSRTGLWCTLGVAAVLLALSVTLVSCAQDTESASEEGAPSAEVPSSKPDVEVDLQAGLAVASEMQDIVNTLVDYTSTTFIPAAGNKAGTYSFIALSEQPVFELPDAKRGWLVVAVAAAGQVLREHGDIEADQIVVTDSSLMRQRKAFAIDAGTGQSLQQRVSSGAITLEKMYSDILAGLEEYKLPSS